MRGHRRAALPARLPGRCDVLRMAGHGWVVWQAIDSNDKSPNESHHLSAAFRVLRNRDCNFLWRMDAGAQQQIRKIMIELVLATDMAEHMAIVSRIKTDIQKRLESPDDAIGEQFPESLHILALQVLLAHPQPWRQRSQRPLGAPGVCRRGSALRLWGRHAAGTAQHGAARQGGTGWRVSAARLPWLTAWAVRNRAPSRWPT